MSSVNSRSANKSFTIPLQITLMFVSIKEHLSMPFQLPGISSGFLPTTRWQFSSEMYDMVLSLTSTLFWMYPYMIPKDSNLHTGVTIHEISHSNTQKHFRMKYLWSWVWNHIRWLFNIHCLIPYPWHRSSSISKNHPK